MIDIKALRFAYPTSPQHLILDIEHWSIDKQQHTFLHGSSGSGKSTLLNIISGVLGGYNGNVSVLGQNLEQLTSRQLDQFRASNIGYVFQQFNLIPFMNAIENIHLACEFSHAKNESHLSIRKNAEHLLTSLNITKSEWDKPISTLSIGQQQRIAIARALANNPELLIADEPTSSLDQDNRDQFITLLMKMAEENETTLLFVSHDQTLSHHFKQVQCLNDINNIDKVAR